MTKIEISPINYVIFHEKLPFIITNSDKTVKLWNFLDDTTLNCVATLEGKSVVVHKTLPFISTKNGGKTLKLWQF